MMARLRLIAAQANDPNDVWFVEAERRLWQMGFLLQRIDRLQQMDHRVGRWQTAATPDQRERRRQRSDLLYEQIVLFTEAFYYVAFRFQTIIKEHMQRSFNPPGVRGVRNHLIEHPDDKGGAPEYNFGYGLDMPYGPVLKPFGPRIPNNPRASGAVPPPFDDKGLYFNAQEVIDLLKPILAAELAKHG
jgi:hypothetical protein